MGIYAREVEQKLKEIKDEPNILHTYDNVNYHIQFFMVPANVMRTYSKKRVEARTPEQLQAVDKDFLTNKCVICETGKTNNLFINSLRMVTTPMSQKNIGGITTYEMEMEVIELNTSSFVNKMTVASFLNGYETYMAQPVFVTIWFDGYENIATTSKGRAVDKIKIDNDYGIKKVTYQLIIGDVKSNIEANKTTYNIKLYPHFYNGINKNSNVLTSIEGIEFVPLFEENFFATLENQLNAKVRKLMSSTIYDQIYGDEGVIKIQLLNKEFILTEDQRRAKYEAVREDVGYSEHNKEVNQIFNWERNVKELKETFKDFNKRQIKEGDGWFKKSLAALGSAVGAGTYQLSMIAARSVITQFKVAFKDLFYLEGAVLNRIKFVFKPTPTDTIYTYIYKALIFYLQYFNAGDKKEYIPNINYESEYLRDYNGQSHYRYYIKINFVKAYGLSTLTEKAIGKIEETYTKTPKSNQLTYLQELTNGSENNNYKNMLKKKYYWNYVGKNIDILSMKKDENNLWFLNVGADNIDKVDTQQVKNSDTTTNKENKGKEENLIDTELLDAYKKEFNNNGSDIYMEDLYRFAKDHTSTTTGIQLTKFMGISVYNDDSMYVPQSMKVITNGSEQEDTKAATEIENSSAKNELRMSIGMEGIFQYTGKKLSLEMDIIGDPYWLIFGSTTFENNQYLCFPHFCLFQKSLTEPDSNDEYQEDKLMEFNSIYAVHKVVSTFSNGKFLQKLTSFVPTPFIESSKYEDSKPTGKKSVVFKNEEKISNRTTDNIPTKKEVKKIVDDHVKTLTTPLIPINIPQPKKSVVFKKNI